MCVYIYIYIYINVVFCKVRLCVYPGITLPDIFCMIFIPYPTYPVSSVTNLIPYKTYPYPTFQNIALFYMFLPDALD